MEIPHWNNHNNNNTQVALVEEYIIHNSLQERERESQPSPCQFPFHFPITWNIYSTLNIKLPSYYYSLPIYLYLCIHLQPKGLLEYH